MVVLSIGLVLLFVVLVLNAIPAIPRDVSVSRSVRGGVARRRGSEAMVDLSRRRVWCADDDDDDKGSDEIDLDALDPAVRAYIESQQARIKELNQESASRRHELKRIRDEEEAKRTKLLERLEQSGDHKRLAEEQQKQIAGLKIDAERAKVLEEQIRANNEAKVALIPDDWREVVPDLPPERLSAWLDQNMPRFTTPKAPDIGAGTNPGGGKPVKLTPEQELAYQTGNWESKEEYLKYLQ